MGYVYLFTVIGVLAIIILTVLGKIDIFDSLAMIGIVLVIMGLWSALAEAITPTPYDTEKLTERREELVIMRAGVVNTDELFDANIKIVEFNDDLAHWQRFKPDGFWSIFIDDNIYLIQDLPIDNSFDGDEVPTPGEPVEL